MRIYPTNENLYTVWKLEIYKYMYIFMQGLDRRVGICFPRLCLENIGNKDILNGCT